MEEKNFLRKRRYLDAEWIDYREISIERYRVASRRQSERFYHLPNFTGSTVIKKINLFNRETRLKAISIHQWKIQISFMNFSREDIWFGLVAAVRLSGSANSI